MSNRKDFCYEINVTKLCNLKCTYCFEGDSCDSVDTIEEHIDQIKSNIYTLLDNGWFNSAYTGVLISFWGGEPTIHPTIIRSFVEEFKDNPRIHYHLYTNGFDAQAVIDSMGDVKEKMSIQVSYDGMPVHDMTRVDRNGTGTSTRVKENIETLIDYGFDVSIKSTLRPCDFKYLEQIWDDIHELNARYGGQIGYAPTIDYSNEYDDTYIEDLRKSMLGICKKELEYYGRNKRHLLIWFERGIEYCGFFKGGLFVDTDGRVMYCHGCGYVGDDRLSFGTIYDSDLVEKIEGNYNTFDAYKYNEDCDRCISKVCYSCNVSKYINSRKEDFMDRWYDFSCQPNLCEYFKLVTKYRMALKKAVGERYDM